MARTTEEIKKEITDAWLADSVLMDAVGVDSSTNTKPWSEIFSKVSITNLMVNLFAQAVNILESLFDYHLQEVGDSVSKRAHTLAWYRETAMAFEDGMALQSDVLGYDNSDLTDEQIADKKIVAKCSCSSVEANYPTILVKAAKTDGKLTDDELTRFTAYMNEYADAGVKLNIRSLDPDKLALKMTVWYDPLAMDDDGNLLINNTKVVENAISDYLESLEYNGIFYPQLLENYILQCDGVKMVRVEKAYAVDYSTEITDYYTPYSGALVYDTTERTGYGITYTNFNTTYQNV